MIDSTRRGADLATNRRAWRWLHSLAVVAGITVLLILAWLGGSWRTATTGLALYEELVAAAERGDRNGAMRALRRGANVDGLPFSQRLVEGVSPLTAAAESGQYSMVQLLLDNHASIEARDAWGMTALRSAAAAGHSDVLVLLIKRGASVCTPAGSSSALRDAISARHLGIVTLLIQAGANPTADLGGGINAFELAKSIGANDIVDHMSRGGAEGSPRED